MQWIRQAGQRISTGSGRLATLLAGRTAHRVRAVWQRARGWLGESSGLAWVLRAAILLGAAAVLRKVVVAVAAGVYLRVESGAWAWLLWVAAGLWIVAAYRCGRDGWEPKRPAVPDTDEQLPAEEEPATAVESSPGPPPVSPVALVAAVRDIGTPHAQLKPLAEHLGTTTDAVRAAAAGIGWPVKDVRMEGRSSSAGLRWDDCPSPTILAPSSTVVGAGQPADDNDDDTGGEGPEKGVRVVRTNGGLIVYDLADRHRRRGIVRP
jgi:hypothetical protein